MRRQTKIRRGRGLMMTGLLLMAAALILTGYNLWDQRRADHAAAEILVQIQPEVDEAVMLAGENQRPDATGLSQVPDYVLNPNMEMPEKEIDGEQYIGVLDIPALGLSLPVMSEWSYPRLKTAPCRYHGSAYTDDMIIAGHNYQRHFSPLKTLGPGERIRFTDMAGNRFVYEVSRTEILARDAVEEMEAGDWDLTLFTCTYGGQTRFTLRCTRILVENDD